MKHKTQVFFAPKNDHICTRMEHVNHVASVSSTISKYLGLNEQLSNAISLGHDIGHAPFGHHGESCINDIYKRYNPGEQFWHEKNSLLFADFIETLQDPGGFERPLDLTYAVRDGIICHCGEIDENGLKPRSENRDLYKIEKAGQYQPYTWEGCVVKISDKISYLGRDIEDARQYHIIDQQSFGKLKELVRDTLGEKPDLTVNTTVLINELIVDICNNSTPETGLCFSENCFRFIRGIKKFNADHIYTYWKIEEFKKYTTLIINTIFESLLRTYPEVKKSRRYSGSEFFTRMDAAFREWLIKYTDFSPELKKEHNYATEVLFHIDDEGDYIRCIGTFISGMTDQFAIKTYEDLISF
ncbi:MAG: HD domain-containing protein [Spirochaetaceae bacterium]|nr:HD domain-containing protein [Spirochaetaceae bacterium]